MKISGAEIVIKSLLHEGAETIFGYPGGAIMPVYDALYEYMDQLQHILVRHEQGAVHAAQGYSRASGKVGVCMATSGPGATNLITGIADAMIDSTPLVCITGQVPAHLLGTDAFQETDVVDISMPVTKWNYQVTSPEDIAPAIAKAFYIARSGRPGPVLVDITKNAQVGLAEYIPQSEPMLRSYHPHPKCDENQIEQTLELIDRADKPLILLGQGVSISGAEKEFVEFVEKSGIPFAATLMGLSAASTSHPKYVGMLGMHGNYAPNVMTNEADLIIAIGMRFDDRVTGDVNRYAVNAKVIHIDIDKSEFNKNIPTDVCVHADAKEALQRLNAKVQFSDYSSWLKAFHDGLEKEKHELKVHDISPDAPYPLTMKEVIMKLSQLTEGKAVVVTDVGQHQMVTARYYDFQDTRTNITSGGLGTMGFALPAAIGAKLSVPEKTVVMVAGDGSFQMNIQELGTIMQNGIDVKILVLNNHFLGMVRQWQQLFYEKRYSFTEIDSPDFIMLAKSYGISGKSITQPEDLEAALQEMLEHKGSYLLEVKVAKEDNVFPMVPAGASVSEIRLK
ncbi:biosynthetic-type acetolactate synthase large subunit [Elizabethkingia sp. JS20170427COW]|uniref:biosynthetic-type acetolactate synthase large subunit n=1 Tax=Elizabethkingia sp. JS20170427COW TaxID=2583851 RepID=UPI001110F3A1|nr:biosynthetic-type acetolactate synthase large subunit [Elizabethkingia sp. JS20170427COW]QCX52762.1 biosynthetic-type acetolactate synthase large subunit [Elizabethkingia sp. JS20170427COW]